MATTSLSGQTYVDYVYNSQIGTDGELQTVTDYEAVENALRLWLYSLKGERIRKPEWGGYVTRWLFKPLNEDTAENLQFSILIGLKEEFEPSLNISTVTVTPDYDEQSWTVEIEATDSSSNEDVYVIENIRRIV